MKNRDNYTAEELAQDHGFISWVKGDMSVSKERDWQAWVDQNPEKKSIFDDAILLVNALKFKEDEVSQSREDSIWSSINSNIESKKSETNEGVNRRTLIRKIAYFSLGMAATLGLYLFVSLPSGDIKLNTDFAQAQSHNLPDGSMVIVNSDSKLAYNIKEWNKERKIELTGEAFFEVEKGATFTVLTPHGKVIVLGTSFNVYSREDQMMVYCETGQVSVESKNKKSLLMPGNTVTVKSDHHTDVKTISSQQNRSTWRKGIYSYKSTSLSEVVQELKRQFNVNIQLPIGSNEVLFTGSFSNSDIDSALSEVLWPLGFKYTKRGDTIVVSK